MHGYYDANKGEGSISKSPKNSKLKSDNFEIETLEYKVLCEGMVINSVELMEREKCDSFSAVVEKWLAENMSFENILKMMRGSYIFSLFDKTKAILYVANDYLSNKPLYYYKGKEYYAFSTSFIGLSRELREKGIKLSINKRAMNEMNTRGSFLLDDTYIDQIHFLEPRQYLKITDKKFKLESYRIEVSNNCREVDQMLDQAYHWFEQGCRMMAKKLIFTKNNRPCISVSGGMDSRVVLCTMLKLLGEDNVIEPLCFSYGAKECKDLKIASELAGKYGLDLVRHDINEKKLPFDREVLLEAAEGQMYYIGTTGLNRTLRALNLQNVDIILAGIGGGEVFGDAFPNQNTDDEQLYSQRFNGICSSKELESMLPMIKEKYSSFNEFVQFQELRVYHNFSYTASPYVAVFSPFLYEEFFEYLLTIPSNELKGRKFYSKWYMKFIGDMSECTAFGGKPHVIKNAKNGKLQRRIRKSIYYICGKKLTWNMNPFEYWWNDSQEVQNYINNTFIEDIEVIDKYDHSTGLFLKQEFEKCGTYARFKVLTTSGMLKKIFL